ncbi:hypothetical protein [Sporolactobacillus sp. THM19-2]|uniref:hypothetical protein n=1 Tax=Sporolactobacillus sp. THM19-2 TaxID=2511171 RepID=UPI00101EC5B5|nr:hypothetical protein [Sporolactobacillus sp. THM19-2]RYL92595.1 hypothetical protein EWH91_06960 [Sporolactobacillus sp. THM19-2]
MLVEFNDLDNLFHITEPWYVHDCIFNESQKKMDVYLKVYKEAFLTCPSPAGPHGGTLKDTEKALCGVVR